jgi:predicted transcriptional regulator
MRCIKEVLRLYFEEGPTKRQIAQSVGVSPTTVGDYIKTEVPVLDDWGLAPLTAEARHDLLEIMDDRHGRRFTVVTSQLPIGHRHEAIGDPTLADAIMDRLVHNAYTSKLAANPCAKMGSIDEPGGFSVKTQYPRRFAPMVSSFGGIRTVAHKLCRAAYFMLRDQVPFDAKRLFAH